MAEEQTSTSKILLFNKWDTSEVVVKDQGLVRYVTVTSTEVPSSCGRLTQQQFTKSQMAIVERLINRLMQTEANTGTTSRNPWTLHRSAVSTLHSATLPWQPGKVPTRPRSRHTLCLPMS